MRYEGQGELQGGWETPCPQPREVGGSSCRNLVDSLLLKPPECRGPGAGNRRKWNGWRVGVEQGPGAGWKDLHFPEGFSTGGSSIMGFNQGFGLVERK